ncbi:MAG: FliO/MopB family protein [Thermodesulfobacteria bacterium]|nr:FliO/MopB family protein [Thermodesulfobacteriota bacterium]
MDSLELIAKMTGALALVLGVMFIVALVLRRLGLVAQSTKKGVIEVVENRAILPKRYISLVKVAGNYYLIGSTEQGITLLGSLDSLGAKGFDEFVAEEVAAQSGKEDGHE